jgi:hypothetical protein
MLNNFPSGVLKRGGSSPVTTNSSGLWAWNNRGSTPHKQLRHHEHLAMDTHRMADKLGREFSLRWDYDKMYKKHEQYTEAINLLKYSPEPFKALANITVKQLSFGDYEATLLNNAKDIRNEGATMRHCVGGYSDSCEYGKYLVYSIKKEGKRSSTLGISITAPEDITTDTIKYSFSQHYKQCNKRVECEDAVQLAKNIIRQLNN